MHTEDEPTLPLPARRRGNALPDGTHLAEFEIRATVGEGGFGIVYAAWDDVLKRQVAIKEYMPWSLAARVDSRVVPNSDSATETFVLGLRSFINEAQLLASFDHPSLLKVYRFWEDNGTAYMVMPFYRGVTLKRALAKLAAPPEEGWLKQQLGHLLDALEVMHAASCFHRDIAPDNILLLDEGVPLLLDFGAARRVVSDRTETLTAFLKPGYAPVEQYAVMPDMKQGPWTDLYALASVVHYAITGHTPPESVARLVCDTCVPLVKAAADRYSDAFLCAIDHALAVRPEQRPQSVAQMRMELGLQPPKLAAHKASEIPTAPQSFDSRPVPLDDATVPPPAHARPAPPPARTLAADAVRAGADAAGAAALRSHRWSAAVAVVAALTAATALAWWTLRPHTEGVPTASSMPRPMVETPAVDGSRSAASLAAPSAPDASAARDASVTRATSTGSVAPIQTPADVPAPTRVEASTPPVAAGAGTADVESLPAGSSTPPEPPTARTAPQAKQLRVPPRLNSTDPRCADIIARVSLGEVPTVTERVMLQGECRK